jgi:hypothetical protein
MGVQCVLILYSMPEVQSVEKNYSSTPSQKLNKNQNQKNA